jgi:hypothetical protein
MQINIHITFTWEQFSSELESRLILKQVEYYNYADFVLG